MSGAMLTRIGAVGVLANPSDENECKLHGQLLSESAAT